MTDSSRADAGRLPRVALVGRQNVGKSTLLNRLLGAREAIAHEQPGVTRDRLEVTVDWAGREFAMIDTGGFVRRARGIEAEVTRQAERAMAEADVILLVVDVVPGIQEEDALLARRLLRATAPVILVANKVDSEMREADAAELYRLGLGDPIAVSALHGRGSGDLLDRVVAVLPSPPQAEVEGKVEGEPVFAIVGRPNVGKSSLFNRLVGDERSVVYEEAGTTRDAIDEVVELEGRPIRFVDTAGFRRPMRMQGPDYYSFLRTVRAIERAHVAALVLDAEDGVTTEDRRIAARVAEAGRGLVAVANKWDLVDRDDRARRQEEIREGVEVFPGVVTLRTSAKTGAAVGKVLPALLAVHERWTKRVSTSEVNRVLQQAQDQHPPPRGSGRLLYGTQTGAGPPRFVVFATARVQPGYRRFLENRLRTAFGLDGVPVWLSFRGRRRDTSTARRRG